MENFLNFLSNNYIYFLIAAGVLFFALIGLLVDMRKKHDGESEVSEESTPEVFETAGVPEPITPEPTIPEPTPIEEPVQEDFNPAPPMPEEIVSVAEENPVLDSTPVMNIEAPVEPSPVETQEEIK